MRCIAIDLEVKSDRIAELAGVDARSGEALKLSCEGRTGRNLRDALAQLDEFARPGDCLVGHNLIDFDLPHLAAAAPELDLLRMPVVDTLRLNPLAFPANPYHKLVKLYQDGRWVRGQTNDPEQDSRLALKLLESQRGALQGAEPDLLAAWHWLTGGSASGLGFDAFFAQLRGSPRPPADEARAAMDRRLSGRVCRAQGRSLPVGGEDGWPLAYALAWLSVAEGNSVLPGWVRHRFPAAGRLIRRLRDRPCADARCAWCRERHDAAKELKRWFGFDGYRTAPATPDGASMQRAVVERAMAGGPVLAILPTGAGKSICYQVPALSRHAKTGALTVVISPLVALMADQVAGLEARGISSCVTVNGMLTPPERADALDRVRLGDAAILLTSPEQLRNESLRKALGQREIGAWVLDEAHCLSAWGHDFRPDYRFVGRFIGERRSAQGAADPPPPVTCLTATARPEVVAGIQEHFRETLGMEFTVFNGGSERDNLEFEVRRTDSAHKLDDIHEALTAELPVGQPGGAIVYCATRRRCEDVAEHLRRKGADCEHFHAGLAPEAKKRIQQRFIDGEVRVIAATNAFGMGIDKPDVRLVVHADIPGSLENYLQEAGRAGRDRKRARCVLLHAADDLERQFGMSARSRLSRREIQGVLKALRRVGDRQRDPVVVATPGEILVDDEDGAFERDSATDDTRVRTAVSWLEEAALLRREENRVKVFPSSLRVRSADEAKRRLDAKAGLTQSRRDALLRIVRALIAADPDEGVSTDELMGIARLDSPGVRNGLHDLEHFGLVANDMALTAYVHVAMKESSQRRLKRACELEAALIALMREQSPDLAKGEAQDLHLRVAAQRLRNGGLAQTPPDRLSRILRSLERDGRGDERAEEGSGGSIKLHRPNRELARITLLRSWRALARTAERRRDAAGLLLDHLLAALPKGARGADQLAETTLGKLRQALAEDMVLNVEAGNLGKLLDRALLWLHEQEVIRLNRGLTVFQPAMTVRLEGRPGTGARRRQFGPADFEPLALHYQEQVRQTHIMAEFAARGLQAPADALRLARDYFGLERGAFLDRWLPNRGSGIKRETTPDSWTAIVGGLSPNQREIVADPRERADVLVLAGPGAGKTRVLAHRIAYLLRVRRERPQGILALAYNRHAAVEIRRRIEGLVGSDAKGVTVMTCHAMAMRLAGASFAAMQRTDAGDARNAFRKVLREATALLQGEGLPPDEADAQRDRLLAGFRHILVDEYQDLDGDQYELIAAMAGRTRNDPDSKLALFAVGDDDQNVYGFMGASVKFIQRFKEDYDAEPVYLTENYRSTAHIIDAANALIAPAEHRMKRERPIEVDRKRRKAVPGGTWASWDPVGQGRVQIIPAGGDDRTQAQAAIAELTRLQGLAAPRNAWDWRNCAVIARRWQTLEPVRSLCELKGIPAQMASEETGYFWRLRETRALRDWLAERAGGLVTAGMLEDWADAQHASGWMDALLEAVAAFRAEHGAAECALEAFLEWLAEWGRDFRRAQRGLLLVTAHSAKGLEFDHVVILDDQWRVSERDEDPDAWRRLHYVAMTRAKQTLALASLDREGRARRHGNPQPRQPRATPAVPLELRDRACALLRPAAELPPPPPELGRIREALTLADVNLGFPGRHVPSHAIHGAIRRLRQHDPLDVLTDRSPWELATKAGQVIGRLAKQYEPKGQVQSARVHAVVGWGRDDSAPEFQEGLPCDEWEVVVPELVFDSTTGDGAQGR